MLVNTQPLAKTKLDMHFDLIFLIYFSQNLYFVLSVCEKSYITWCETFSDVAYNKSKKTWSELLVQPNKYEASLPKYTLTKELLSDLDNLESLVIDNELKKIERNAFAHCKNLKNLIIYGNNLDVIKQSTFVSFWNLDKLSLENNQIKRIERMAFKSTNIQFLDLSYNKLSVLQADTFVKNCRLGKLSVAHNELVLINIESLPKNLKKLNLDYNKLDSIPDGLDHLEELKELTISHNFLNDLSNLERLNNLEKFVVSFNNIDFIKETQFDHLQNLKHLDLSGNNLQRFVLPTSITNSGFEVKLLLVFNRLRNLDLSQVKSRLILLLAGNPWNCKCAEKIDKSVMSSKYLISRTICDMKFSSLGQNPVCVNDSEVCSENALPESVFQRFKQAIQGVDCDLFNDLESFVN